MRPKLITPRNIILFLLAVVIFTGLVVWLRSGGQVPWVDRVPSTAGKLAYVSSQNGQSDIYMVDGTTGKTPVNLTNDNKGTDGEPAWSSDGNQLALTSDRNGTARQLYLMNAAPGMTVRQLTNTSTTKEEPLFVEGRQLFFLDAGKASRVDIGSSDIDIIFPTLESIKQHFATLFEEGGLGNLTASADGDRLVSVLGQEHGDALLVYFPDSEQLVCLGVAQTVKATALPDGRIAALFLSCDPTQAPLPQPLPLFNPSAMSPEMLSVYKVPRLMGSVRLSEETSGDSNAGLLIYPPHNSGLNAFVIFDKDLKPTMAAPLPFAPNGIAASPDGSKVVVTSDNPKSSGVYLLATDGSRQITGVVPAPASQPAVSPDGSKVAFVAKKDIYITDLNGTTPPINVTQGKGDNHNPAWSPAKP